jgi:hypothetical protein
MADPPQSPLQRNRIGRTVAAVHTIEIAWRSG